MCVCVYQHVKGLFIVTNNHSFISNFSEFDQQAIQLLKLPAQPHGIYINGVGVERDRVMPKAYMFIQRVDFINIYIYICIYSS